MISTQWVNWGDYARLHAFYSTSFLFPPHRSHLVTLAACLPTTFPLGMTLAMLLRFPCPRPCMKTSGDVGERGSFTASDP